MRYTIIEAPIGELIVTRDDIGITGVYLPEGRNAITVNPEWTRDDAAFEDARTQFAEYFAGTRREFDLPLHPKGSAFQLKVWNALNDIPYGETTSYGKQAAAIGFPDGARAVGAANGQNPLPIIVPCHRVIGANGSLVGYGGGIDTKRWLLNHEQGRVGLFA